jgi:hypothetical protein
MKAFRLLFAAALAGVLLPAAARAAAPPNDRFAAAHVLSGESGAVTGSNVGAGSEVGEPVPRAGGRTSVWYRWTAPFTGVLVVDTCGSGFDTVVGIYDGDAFETLAELTANDDACGTGSRAAARVELGAIYHVVVSGLAGSSGPLVLRWARGQAPANDELARAEELTGSAGRAAGSTAGATAEAGEPAHDGSGASIWYRWTAPFSGTVVFDSCASSFDSLVTALAGVPPVDLEARGRGSDDDCGSLRSRIEFRVSAGSAYLIAVDGTDGAAGEVTLSWFLAPPPANDEFDSARAIAGVRGALVATTAAATRQEGEPAHGAGESARASVWYRWRAPRSMTVGFGTCGSEFDTTVGVYVGARVAALRLLEADDDSCPADAGSVVVIRAQRGVVYRVAVDGFGTGAFSLRWGPPSIWRECAVPDLRGLTLPQARSALADADCSLGRVHRVASGLVPRGRIVSQYPFPSRRLPYGAAVAVEVSTGPRR